MPLRPLAEKVGDAPLSPPLDTPLIQIKPTLLV